MAFSEAITDMKEARISLRTRPQDKAIIERAAELLGLKVSQFIMRDALKHAKEVLEEEGVMVLTSEDRKTFVDAFLSDHKATPYMKRAIKEYKQDT
ncbi:MAG: hypothetical protein COA43_00810 [Robiginitomaculum sp.]|nr:MAG: hypothetical protein COA43_00810 [Robiginitomaculum sp.]